MEKREIKFQVLAKNKIVGIERLNGNQWEWQYFLLNPDKGERWCSGVFGNANDLIRRQYIERKDKYGNEIYDGDIIGFENFEYDLRIDYIDYYVVCFGKTFDERYGYFLQNNSNQKIFYNEFSKGIVMGNIYQTPELLK